MYSDPAEESREFAARAADVRGIGIRSTMLQTTFVTALTLVSALALALVYGVGGTQALLGHLDAGSVVALGMLPDQAVHPAHHARERPHGHHERGGELRARVRGPGHQAPDHREPGARALPEGPVAVEFDHVSFSYPSAEKVSLASLEDVAVLDSRGGEEVLHDVSFRAAPGHTVALVGSSGAGKSTIAQLVARLYDVDSGEVSMGGQDVRDTTFESLRHTVGMVMQDGHLFHDTIPGHLAVAREDAADEEVWDALERSRLRHVIASLPDGLDTVVGERGYRLSGGERQRLTIARLLLARPRGRPGRGHLRTGLHQRGPRAGRTGRGHVRAHRRGDRPPAVPLSAGRTRSWWWRPVGSPSGAPTRSCSRAADATRSCTRPSSPRAARTTTTPGSVPGGRTVPLEIRSQA